MYHWELLKSVAKFLSFSMVSVTTKFDEFLDRCLLYTSDAADE